MGDVRKATDATPAADPAPPAGAKVPVTILTGFLGAGKTARGWRARGEGCGGVVSQEADGQGRYSDSHTTAQYR